MSVAYPDVSLPAMNSTSDIGVFLQDPRFQANWLACNIVTLIKPVNVTQYII